ncbi:GNAT family N-acetyltransferase [Pseudomonas sp. NFX1]|uniref:GNAT family N-acetyltransferase n=1 Tax=Pseudomonas sp. NFX1 TaxID=2201355 RepID=UPI003DA73752
MECHIRPATSRDVAAISCVVLATLRQSNSHDYPPDVVAQVEKSFYPEAIITPLTSRRVYEALLGDNIISTAGLDRDVVRSVFVDPAHQKGGIGRHLMEVIHTTAASARVGAVHVPSSITAERFYTALGYQKIRDEFYWAERTIVMENRL